MSDYVRRIDEEAPRPTDYATAVCRCTYSGMTREYQCVACRSGYGPNRAHLGRLTDETREMIRREVRHRVLVELRRMERERIADTRGVSWRRRFLMYLAGRR